MESREVDSSVVTFENVFDGRKVVEGIEGSGSAVGRVLAEARNVPDADSLVLRSGDDEVLLRVELRRHDVVGVSSEDCNAVTRGTVPDSNCLVVRARELNAV